MNGKSKYCTVASDVNYGDGNNNIIIIYINAEMQ